MIGFTGRAGRWVPLPVFVVVVLILLVIGGVFAVKYWFVAAMFPGPVTSVSRYAEVLTAFKQARPTYVAHFPPAIPKDATGVRMHFEPGALQGSTSFELRICLPPAKFAAELAKAQAGNAAFKPASGIATGMRVHFSVDKGQGASSSRQGFTLGAGPGLDAWGMALDSSIGEVVYWAVDD